jgi:hypothetical protein
VIKKPKVSLYRSIGTYRYLKLDLQSGDALRQRGDQKTEVIASLLDRNLPEAGFPEWGCLRQMGDQKNGRYRFIALSEPT